MSRTTLCVATATLLSLVSIGLMLGRYRLFGDEVKVPLGPGTWKVSFLIQGQSTGSDARLITGLPLDFGRQHIWKENSRSNELLPRSEEHTSELQSPDHLVCRLLLEKKNIVDKTYSDKYADHTQDRLD